MNHEALIGKKVICRTYSAGVHYGTLTEHEGKQAILVDSRRIFRWSGALSLNEIASKGVDLEGSKITEPVEAQLLTEVIEILIVSPNSNLP